ncbi:MAG: hypothetical protein J5595_10995 [Bacteroidales bacterium]|nr:hypothetical protein [Bacteroidales bacterium]
MKRTIKIALLAMLSALFCAASCGDDQPEEPTPSSICSFAKQVKDSTINAGIQANL